MKTINQVTIKKVEFVELMPEIEEQGVIYISEKYQCSRHLCLCGCGLDTIMRLGKGHWNYTIKNNKISFTPSILQRWECKSHYIITDNVANFV